jgi:hypothetical protein
VLWQRRESSGIHASPSFADFDGDGALEVLAAWSYGNVLIADAATGAPRWEQELAQDDGGIEGLFGSPIPLPTSDGEAPGVLVQPTAWWGEDDGVVLVGAARRAFRSYEGRVSASAVVADLGDDGELDAVIGTEAGELLALTAGGGRAVLASLGAAIEAPVFIVDVDGDQAHELIVAANDGKLRCFETGTRATPVVARFRGNDPRNHGNLGRISLAWSVRPPNANAAPSPVRVDYLTCCRQLTDAASRAPHPEDRLLMQAAADCLGAAAEGVERSAALRQLADRLGTRSALPDACR